MWEHFLSQEMYTKVFRGHAAGITTLNFTSNSQREEDNDTMIK